MKRICNGYAWAWIINLYGNTWAVCNWSYPSKNDLMKSGKPSPEAMPRKVRMELIKKGGKL